MKLILLLLVFSFLECSFYQTRKGAYATKSSAFYKIERGEFERDERKILAASFKHPVKFEQSKLQDILGNIKFKKSTRIIELRDYVFHLNELETLTRDLKQVLDNTKSDEVIQVISMYDHTQSVISGYKRTSFLIWVDELGLNVLFGQIQKEVSRDDSKNFFDWTQIPQIYLRISASLDENEIEEEKESSFSFAKIDGFNNRKWLIFSLRDLDKYKLKERKILAPSSKKED